jgi:hypothetical protein
MMTVFSLSSITLRDGYFVSFYSTYAVCPQALLSFLREAGYHKLVRECTSRSRSRQLSVTAARAG